MKKNREKMRHGRAVKTKESHKKRAEKKEKRAATRVDSLLKFILTRKFDLFNTIILNYLNSDYETGVWEPIFPEIHEKDPDIMPLRECADAVVAKYRDEKGNLSDKGKALYTWLMMPLKTKQTMYRQIESKLFNEDGSAKIHDPEVWQYTSNVYKLLNISMSTVPQMQEEVPASAVPSDVGTFVNALT
jgi:hypothetical protein